MFKKSFQKIIPIFAVFLAIGLAINEFRHSYSLRDENSETVTPPDDESTVPGDKENIAPLETTPEEPEKAPLVSPSEEVMKSVPELPVFQKITVQRGQTLGGILKNYGLTSKDIHTLIQSLKKYYQPSQLRQGTEIHFKNRVIGDKVSGFEELHFRPTATEEIRITQIKPSQFKTHKHKVKFTKQTFWVEGTLETSLYKACLLENVPVKIIHDLIRLYSYDVDFQRSLKQGDKFGLYYTMYHDEYTNQTRPGELLHAQLMVKGKTLKIYRFQPKGGTVGYYNENGQNIRKSLLRTPVDGARISSKFGKRHHPVLGYTKMHKGVDFAAPTGTPIVAAGDGNIDYIGRLGAYGLYIRIRHNTTFSTAYGHMSRFAKGLRRGSLVCQGQRIGYVGRTGRATGPHLHYEVLKAKKQVNPLSLTFLPSRKLNKNAMRQFNQHINIFETQIAKLKNYPQKL